MMLTGTSRNGVEGSGPAMIHPLAALLSIILSGHHSLFPFGLVGAINLRSPRVRINSEQKKSGVVIL
jgi:hypothetical protein